MNEELRELLTQSVSDVFEFHDNLRKTVRLVLGTEDIRPGFQHIPKFLAFEKEHGFATGEAISAFARHARKELTPSERERQTRLVRGLVSKIAATAKPTELTRLCFDVSLAVSLMLEELGIWALCYMGTLIYENEAAGLQRFYFVDDVYKPPKDSQARGHMWIYTPAFPLVDLTAKFQVLRPFFSENTPFPLLSASENTSLSPQSLWYVDPDDPQDLQKRKWELLANEGNYPDFNLYHRPIVHRGIVNLFFVPMSMGFGDEPLKNFRTTVKIGGKTPRDFFESVRQELV